jgi:hypothetical protein
LEDIIFLKDVESAVQPPDPIVAYDDELGGYLAGTTGWSNTAEKYLGYGVEAEAEVFPADGFDVHANIAFGRILESLDGETTRDESMSEWKVNTGVTWRTPYRTDVSLDANYASPQVWGLRSFDSAGQIVVTSVPIDSRLILSGRIGVRPLPDDSLELALGFWNIGTALNADDGLFSRFREHPKGQPIGPKALASAAYRF